MATLRFAASPNGEEDISRDFLLLENFSTLDEGRYIFPFMGISRLLAEGMDFFLAPRISP
jgi:hypothetical protein